MPARRSRLGVFTTGCPRAPSTRPLCWSEQMKTMLGRRPAAGAATTELPSPATSPELKVLRVMSDITVLL